MQMPQHGDLMRSCQFFGGLVHTLILAADQDKAADIAPLGQTAHEFKPVHFRHIDIQQDQIGIIARMIDQFQCGVSVVASGNRGVAEIFQHAGEQFMHKRLVVEHQNIDRGVMHT